MPPEGIYSVLDRGQFLFQFVHQHAVSPVHQVEAPFSKLQGIFDPQGSAFILIARSWIQTVLIIPHHREKSIVNGMHCCSVHSVTI
jgi:hypothetical protein